MPNKSNTESVSNIEPALPAGIYHELPKDIETLLRSAAELTELWIKLTPIQRNEWICWVTYVKKTETRTKHLQRMKEELIEGRRTPCCWPGCPHRRASAAKYFK